MSPDHGDYSPPMPQPTLQHWHTLLATAAATDEPYAKVPVESLMDLLHYAATATDVIYDAGLDGVVSSEVDDDVRGIGRHLRVVTDEPDEDE